MHFSILVVTQKRTTAANTDPVDSTLERYEGQHYDWYQIGGRWTGTLDGYDPEKDPANIKQCNLCGGSGVRSDSVGIVNGFDKKVVDDPDNPRHGQVGWCNGCQGAGRSVEWPTQYPVRDGDTIPVAELTEEQYAKFHGVCVEGWDWFGSEDYIPWAEGDSKFQPKSLPPIAWIKANGNFATVVDCHN